MPVLQRLVSSSLCWTRRRRVGKILKRSTTSVGPTQSALSSWAPSRYIRHNVYIPLYITYCSLSHCGEMRFHMWRAWLIGYLKITKNFLEYTPRPCSDRLAMAISCCAQTSFPFSKSKGSGRCCFRVVSHRFFPERQQRICPC